MLMMPDVTLSAVSIMRSAGVKFVVTAKHGDGGEQSAKRAKVRLSLAPAASVCTALHVAPSLLTVLVCGMCCPRDHQTAEEFNHFSGSGVDRFLEAHNGRQGIAVLGFEVGKGGVAEIQARYADKHPKLLVGEPMTYSDFVVLEVYAYYKVRLARALGSKPGTRANTHLGELPPSFRSHCFSLSHRACSEACNAARRPHSGRHEG